MLCQLSYGPPLADPVYRGADAGLTLRVMARRKRPALGALFLLLALGFAGIAYSAAVAGDAAWIVAGAAALMAVWMGEQAYRSLR